jgi:hypothetical protein
LCEADQRRAIVDERYRHDQSRRCPAKLTGLASATVRWIENLPRDPRLCLARLSTIPEQAEITSNPRALKCCAASEVRFALDSPLEESGFELLVPRWNAAVPKCVA